MSIIDVRSRHEQRHDLGSKTVRLHNLKGLRTLMVVRDVSQRRLARAAGYRSHAYLGRLLRGQVDTLEPEAALRIARFLQVDASFLFAPRVSIDAAQSAQHHKEAPV
jgi:transcriptional regulator with XRE-family HTH domain